MLLGSLHVSGGAWTFAGIGVLAGIITGFAVPLAASYQPRSNARAHVAGESTVSVLEVAPAPPAATLPGGSLYDVKRDSEVERLEARNRRLMAMLAALRRESAKAKPDVANPLTSQAVFGQN